MKKQTLSGLMIVTHTNEEQQPPDTRDRKIWKNHISVDRFPRETRALKTQGKCSHF
jgi:hypothetical protein